MTTDARRRPTFHAWTRATIRSLGIHGRPLAGLVERARRFASEIRVRPEGSTYRDAKRILRTGAGLRGTCWGSRLEFSARGPDAPRAVLALKRYVERGLHPWEAQPLQVQVEPLEELLKRIRDVLEAGEITDDDRREIGERAGRVADNLRYLPDQMRRGIEGP